MSKVVIPHGIRIIGSKAFLSCESLEELVLPDSVVEIGRYAFHNYKKLTEITIPGSVKATPHKDCRPITSSKFFVRLHKIDE